MNKKRLHQIHQIDNNVCKMKHSIQLHREKIIKLNDSVENMMIKKYILFFSSMPYNHDYFAMMLSTFQAVGFGLNVEDKSVLIDTKYKELAVINLMAQHSSKSVMSDK